MTLYAITAYLRYRWQARGRHGTHSPFVYEFVEAVARGPFAAQGSGDRYERLLSAIRTWYQCDVAVIDHPHPQQWAALLQHQQPALHAGFVAIKHIHATPAHTAAWAALCSDAGTMMSMDLYGIGLLLTRPGFKVKQHFVVLY